MTDNLYEPATAANEWVNTIDSKNPEVLEKAHQIIKDNLYCVLSTCSSDGYPWVSPVFFAYEYDGGYHLYWSSAVVAKHSQNLSRNQGRVAVSIFNSAVPQGTAKGLYFYGAASELHPSQIGRVMKLMVDRANIPMHRTVQDYLNDSPRRLYHFRPQEAWLTGERLPVGNQLVDTKIQISLPDL